MVKYIGVHEIGQLLRELGTAPFIGALAKEIEADYRRWPEFEKSARLASHSGVGVIELMPVSDGAFYSFKYVNGHPKNTAKGLLTVTAFGMLADVATGYPLLVSELTVVTALRTAAMSVAAARHLARPDSRSMALIGCGAQSEFQALAFAHEIGIRELRIFDIDRGAMLKLERNLRSLPELKGLRIVHAKSIAAACRGADIVTTATADKRNAVILTPAMLEPGMHVNAIGGDCPGKTELKREILFMPRTHIVVEYEPQSRIEGEIQQLPPGFPVTEFAAIATGQVPGRRDRDEITIFDSVGFAIEDYSALRHLYRLVCEAPRRAREIDLVPTLDDPKNLFGGTIGRGGRANLREAG
jgi:ornithine cyclodeaminase